LSVNNFLKALQPVGDVGPEVHLNPGFGDRVLDWEGRVKQALLFEFLANLKSHRADGVAVEVSGEEQVAVLIHSSPEFGDVVLGVVAVA
jgi:hypothetical protein